MRNRKQYDNGFKARVALEAIKNERTIAQIASEYSVHPNQVTQWKKRVLEALPEVSLLSQVGTNGIARR